MPGYRELAAVCHTRGYRLLLHADTHRRVMRLSRLEVRQKSEPLVLVSLLDHDHLDGAADVALLGLRDQKLA